MRIDRATINDLIEVYGSQRKLAKSLGVNQSTVSRLASGKIKNPKRSITQKIERRERYYRNVFLYRYTVRFYNARARDYGFASTGYTTIDRVEDQLRLLIMQLQQSDRAIQIIEQRLIRSNRKL